MNVECAFFTFPLSAYSSPLINLNLMSIFLATTSHCMAVRVQGNNADKALGLFSYTKLCIFSFHLAYYQTESWQEAAFTLMAQMKSYLAKDDLQRCELVEGNQQRMLRHPGAGHSRKLLIPSGPKRARGENGCFRAQRGLRA